MHVVALLSGAGAPFLHEGPHKVQIDWERAVHELEEASRIAKEAADAVEAHPRSPRLKAAKASADAAVVAAAATLQTAKAARDERIAGKLPLTETTGWYVVLNALYGDSPFACKLRKSTAPTSLTACPSCFLKGSKKKPNQDGSRGAVTLQRVAFGGAACKCEYQQPILDRTVDSSGKKTYVVTRLDTKPGFSYAREDLGHVGEFSEQDADKIRISKTLDKLLADLAERISAEEAAKFHGEIRKAINELRRDRKQAPLSEEEPLPKVKDVPDGATLSILCRS